MHRPEDDSRTNVVEERLHSLWEAYREAVPDPSPSAQFMPALWERIEARRAATLSVRRVAQRFVTAGAALCAVLGLLLIVPSAPPPVASSGTYLDSLMADLWPERSAYAEIHRTDRPTGEVRQ